MPPRRPAFGINGKVFCGENILPFPLGRRIRIFAGQRAGQPNCTEALEKGPQSYLLTFYIARLDSLR